MKKAIIIAAAVLLIFTMASAVVPEENGEGGMHGMQEMMKSNPFMMKSVKAEVKNTENGAEVMLTTADKKDVKEVQEKAAAMVKWRNEMMESGKMEGMTGKGMMMDGMHKHMMVWGIITCVLIYILLILLIILVFYKIRVLAKELKKN